MDNHFLLISSFYNVVIIMMPIDTSNFVRNTEFSNKSFVNLIVSKQNTIIDVDKV